MSPAPDRRPGNPVEPMRVVLISTYDLGRQPFGLASPAAWLREAGFAVRSVDLAVERFDENVVAAARLIAFHLPMHAATRRAVELVPRIRELNPRAHLCFYGLYAPLNAELLRGLGAGTLLGGEFEGGLVELARRLCDERGAAADDVPEAIAPKLRFRVPDRGGLPPLERYAHVHLGNGSKRTVGYTETTRGCKHFCRHCPVVPIYGGAFRVVQREVVVEDVRRQVLSGAGHITFGDPDFWNGPAHALSIVEALHREHPGLSYDVTIKIEHLLKHRRRLADLARTGCLFVTSAVESLDDAVLKRLDKGHTRADFVEALRLCRESGLVLNPTFIAFHPWLSLNGYLELLETLADLDLVDQVASVQLALRLLVPRGSRLLELPEVRAQVGPFDEAALVYPWEHGDVEVDRLQRVAMAVVERESARGASRAEVFGRLWDLAVRAAGRAAAPVPEAAPRRDRAAVPYLTEPWYC
jgi:radical SAM superfamily enzyme YgiQ (UPF0313 family)